MKRSLTFLAIAFLVLFAAITVLKRYGRDTRSDVEEASSEERARIRRFWDHYNRATAARSRGDYQAAVDAYEMALSIDPTHEESLYYLSNGLQELGRYAEAVEVLHRLTAAYPTSNRGLSQLGILLTTLAPGAEPDFEAAARTLETSKNINYEETGPFLREGVLEIHRGDLEKARKALAVAAQAGSPEGLYLAGVIEYVEGDFSAANQLFQRVLDIRDHEKAIRQKGATAEGDIGSARKDAPRSRLDRAAIKSQVFLYWSASQMGGYPETVPSSNRLDLEGFLGTPGRFDVESVPRAASARGAWIDVDRDGPMELAVAEAESLRLYTRSTDGWVDSTSEHRLASAAGAWDVLVTDFNHDGWQDLYIVRNGFMGTGRNQLFRNEQGRFRDVTEEVGLGGDRATARASAADFNADGKPDLLEVGNRGPSRSGVRLFLQTSGRFDERAAQLGLGYAGNAVDAAVADVDGNGRADIFVLGWKSPGRLFLNTPDGFVDGTEQAGLADVGGNGFSATFVDFDQDGHQDLLVTAHADLDLSLLRFVGSPSARFSPRLFRNRLGRFEEVTTEMGLDTSYGVMQAAAADFDGDGWPDIALALGGLERHHLEPSVILRNESAQQFVEWHHLPSLERPARSMGAAAADIDGDGKRELFLSGIGVVKYRP